MALTFVEIDADYIGLADQKIALEHQGEQHHRAVNIFGGDETLKRGLERDAVKRRLYEENSVQLVEIRFDEQLTMSRLRQKLRRCIETA
ncbi:hypothetical protein [Rhizobium binae]|uniref:hypothetical protein n=1 Tax=Rhizobium binae TaxID=1138190 RepID=UPI001C82F072|nr:hypothetical protein [Rhizobium binae]MBX4962156.1 hypothetical protein [Rhizobium binae]